MNLSQVGRWVFVIGVVLAAVAGFINLGIPHFGLILTVVGLVVGFLNISDKESGGFLIAAIALLMTASALGNIPQIGAQLSAVGANLSAIAAPAALVVALKSLLGSAKK